MRKLLITLLVLSSPVLAVTGASVNQDVPNWTCNTEIKFGNGETRQYPMNTKNIIYSASRTGEMMYLNGKADSTGGKIKMYINTTNGKGTIQYYAPDGTEFGKGTAQCKGNK